MIIQTRLETYFDERIPELQQIPENYNRPCRANKRCEHFSSPEKREHLAEREDGCTVENLRGSLAPSCAAALDRVCIS